MAIRPLLSPQRYFVLLALLLGLQACEQRPDCVSVFATATAGAIASEKLSPESVEGVELRWQSGPHAGNIVEGGDSSCARCHARMAWRPLASELPTSWVEAGITGISVSESLNADAWSGVPCEVCHPQPRAGINGEIAWLEVPPLPRYEQVETSSQLCANCHVPLPDRDHASRDFRGVHGELSCTDCHDPHDGSASCGTLCHQPFAGECIEVETHDKPHSVVTCAGCHDASGMAIGWNEELGKWDTFYGGDPRRQPTAKALTSHALGLDVNCDRCHAPGDHPWDPAP